MRSRLRRQPDLAVIALACTLTGGAALTASSTGVQARTNPAKGTKPTMVLFMCPHGAAKSVLASAYFQRLARERGLYVRVESAGTEPDADIAPSVANHLTRNGYAVPVAKPRQVTAGDLAVADVVISIGCDLKGLPDPGGTLVRWDDVPPLSEDFALADEAIRKRVLDLVEELSRRR